MKLILVITLLLVFLSSCSRLPEEREVSTTPVKEQSTVQPPPTSFPTANVTQKPVSPEDAFAFAQNRRLGRGVNLGNALQAPNEGDWGIILEEEFFQLIKEAGFDSVRIPIRWTTRTASESPYTIDPIFLDRVDWAVDQALSRDLVVVINIHDYDELISSPEEQKDRFLAIWDQIASHYQNYPDGLYFEVLNEPHGDFGTMYWNKYAAEAITLIRKTNPERTIIVGPDSWYSIGQLPNLHIPKADRNLIVSIHYYSPYHFTHQGAEWAVNSDTWLGTTWQATPEQRQAVINDFEAAKKWSEKQNRPLYLGEFGVYYKADMDSRVTWTDFVARQAEAYGMSWAYWEFCAGFGVYNLAEGTWNEPILQALLPSPGQ